MKIKELRELSIEELKTQGGELRHELFNLRIQRQSGQLEKNSRIHDARKEIARIETILSERRLSAAAAA